MTDQSNLKNTIRLAIATDSPITKRTHTFEAWTRAVSLFVARKTGLTLEDLPDCSTRDWYDQGISAKVAARKAIKTAGGE